MADILFIISIIAADLGLIITIYLLTLKKVHSARLSRMRIETEVLASKNDNTADAPKFAFDWKYDDFDRNFSVRFVVPTIIAFVLCVVAVASAIFGMILM